MSEAVPGDLAHDLESRIRAVPGVSDVYSAAPLLARAAGELPVGGSVRPALVHVERRSPLRVTTIIGVHPDHDAPAVADRVAAAIRANVEPDASVTVRVGRIAP